MKSTRLFIGGLSGSIDKHMLTSKLSSYGPISDAEIKEKTDAEGIVTARFAYVNIEAAPEQIEQCVRDLNGTSWQGAHLRVEVAKESFLDRLKRERLKTQEQQQKLPKSIQPESLHESYTKGHPTEFEPKVKKKRKSYLLDSNDSGTKLNTSVDQDVNDSVVQPVKVKARSKKKNEAEEEMMASFKTFSSMWADTDEEDDDDEVVQKSAKERKNVEKTHSEKHKLFRDYKDETAENGYATVKDVSSIQDDNNTSLQMQDKRQNWGSPSKISKHNKKESDPPFKTMTRYDPTLQEHQQFRLLPPAPTKEVPSSPSKEVPSVQKKEGEKQAEIPKTKEETVESSCFSLLTMFNQLQQEKPAAIPQDHSMESIREAAAQLPVQKSRSFFLGPRDKRIQDGIDWMLQNVQDNILPEFKAIESDLYDVIKTRSVRAKKEMNKKLNDGKGRGKGKRDSGKSTTYPVIADQNYDHGWRLAEIIQDEKRGGARSHSRGGRDMHSQGEGGSSRGRGGQRGHGRGQGEEDIQNRGLGEEGTYSSGQGEGDGYVWGQGGDAYARGRRGRGNHKWDQGGGGNINWGRGGRGSHSRGRGGRGSRSRGRGRRIGHNQGLGREGTQDLN